MARKKIIRSEVHPYHIWARANNKETFPLPIDQCWSIFNYYLNEITIRYGVEIHSFVLMKNHFHAVITTPNGNLDSVMRYFMTQTSKGIGMASERINHVYGGPYGWTIATTPAVYAILFKYVYRNPVKAKITSKVEEYVWSSFVNKNFRYNLTNKGGYDIHIPNDKSELIEWLNEPSSSELEAEIGRSLKKNGEFKSPKDSNNNLMNLEEYIAQSYMKGAAHL